MYIVVPYRQANLVQVERVHKGSAQQPRSLETIFVFNESLSDHFIAFVFIWLLRMLWTQLDFMMNFIEKWISLNAKLLRMLWTQLDFMMNFIEKNEFHWIRETRSLRTMCVKVITMTWRILLLWLAAGALRGTRTYPNPWRAFLFCLPFLPPSFYRFIHCLSKQRCMDHEMNSCTYWRAFSNKKECFM